MKRFAIFLALVATGILGCKSDYGSSYSTGTPTPNIPPNTVVMSSMTFNPNTITVPKGTTITWRNDDGAPHTSTSDSTGWDTGNMAQGATRTTTFNTAGRFPFHCTYHRGMGMVGTVIVQ